MCAYSTPARSLASKTLQSALRTAATRRLSKPHSGWKLYTAECPLPGVCLLDLSGSLSRACGHLQPKAQREPGPDASGVRTRSPQICLRPLRPAGGVTLPPRLSWTDQWWLFSCLQQLWCQPADGDPCAHRLRPGETRVHRPAGQARSPAAFTSLGKQVSGLRPWQRDYLSTELMNLGVPSPHRTVLCPRPFA